MVNTFLVHRKYKKSARKLNTQRLGKQRVEAYQILCLCQDLHYLAKYYKETVPKVGLYKWIRKIAARYKKEKFRFVVSPLEKDDYIEDIYKPYNIDIVKLIPKKSKFKQPVVIDGIEFRPEDRVVSLGFVYHPAVQMWLGYETALMFYIEKHIEVWIERGYKNTMCRYVFENPENIEHPPWTKDASIHENHKASLLNKEITRKEPKWYGNMEDFVEAEKFIDYIWPIDKS
jgi:hypothetical protein